MTAATPILVLKDRLRVAYFLQTFPSLSETFVLNEIVELDRRGVEVRIISLSRCDEGVVHKIALPLISRTTYMDDIGRKEKWRGLLHLLWRHPWRLLRTLAFVWRRRHDPVLVWYFKQSLALARRLERERMRRIHAHFACEASDCALLVSMLTGLPFSLCVHAVDIYVRPRWLREKMDQAAFVMTVCQYNKEYLLGYHPSVPDERLHVIHLGIDGARFHPSESHVRREGELLHIVSIARLIEKKGLIYLIEALGMLKREGLSFRATIAGDGPERHRLVREAREQGIEERVRLSGPVDTDGVRALLDETDLFVLPCVVAENGDRDATPTVLEEAMAMGVPVISTTVAGIPEIIPSRAGILVPQRDATALAKAIRGIADLDDEARRAMGRSGRDHVLAHFSLEQQVEKLIALFARLQ